MKKVLTASKEVKQINKQIVEFEKDLANIRQWSEATPGDRSDKSEAIEKHEHFIAELQESKVLALRRLITAATTELITLTEVEYEHAAISA